MVPDDILDQRARPPIVAIGGSAGGLEALVPLVRGLPADLAAPVLVVIHGSRSGPSNVPRILSRASLLPAVEAVDSKPLRAGVIYVAPPDHHLVVHDGTTRVHRGPEVNRHRPAIDPLFQSLAASHGSSAIGVVLSGSLDDGAAGVAAIAAAQGTAIIQDPDDALYANMPSAALERVPEARRVPREELADAVGSAVARLAGIDWDEAPSVPRLPRAEAEVAMLEPSRSPTDPGAFGGEPSVLGCPDCGGVLWEFTENGELRFRCRIGHGYSPASLLDAERANVEEGLWTAIRALEEQAALAARLAAQAETAGQESAHRRFTRQAEATHRSARKIRSLLGSDDGNGSEVLDPIVPFVGN